MLAGAADGALRFRGGGPGVSAVGGSTPGGSAAAVGLVAEAMGASAGAGASPGALLGGALAGVVPKGAGAGV